MLDILSFLWVLLAIGIGWTVFVVPLMFWAKGREKRAYNGGFCPACRVPWRRYDTDSQGGRGYTCDSCPRGVWVSYWGIDG